jgi:hypothetical protein
MIEFHKDGTLPPGPMPLPVSGLWLANWRASTIFVFGSNEAGIHGAGAAKVAFEKYGAEWGKGHSRVGYSYAIPTKDKNINTLPLEKIKEYVDNFKRYTFFVNVHMNSVKWFVTRVGCGLAGYKDSQIAPMFKGAVNCSFAEEWKPYLEEQGDNNG